MIRKWLAVSIVLMIAGQAKAQIGAMKMVGRNTEHYGIGFGAFLKGGIPVSEGADATLEIGANVFNEKHSDYTYGTSMVPLKLGYRYTFNGTGRGFYVEPQAGYNLYGVTSLQTEEGKEVNLTYHGVVLAADTGYLFSIWDAPFDLNLRYETVIAHGGSNNLVSLGISRFLSFRKRSSDY